MRTLPIGQVLRTVAIGCLLVTSGTVGQALGTPHSAYGAAGGSTLYRDAFKTQGLKSWLTRGGGTWSASPQGVVRFNGAAEGEVLAPCRLGSTRDFAVQAVIQASAPPTDSQPGYGLVVRATGQPFSGVRGGPYYATNLGQATPMLMWGTEQAGGSGVSLDSGYNAVKLVVHGSDYTLLVNGSRTVQFKIADLGQGRRVGLWSSNQALQVKSFTVTRLQPAPALPELPPVKEANLGASDAPPGLKLLVSHYITMAEQAWLIDQPPATLTESGYMVQHVANFVAPTPPATGPVSVFSYVLALTSSDHARQLLAHDWINFQERWSGELNYTAGNLSGIGDEAHALSFDYFVDTWNSVEAVFFRRGAYEVAVYENFVRGTVSGEGMREQTSALARIIDGHIQKLAVQGTHPQAADPSGARPA